MAVKLQQMMCKSACRYVTYKQPPTAPPTDPLKYGTPAKYIIMGDAGWNPI